MKSSRTRGVPSTRGVPFDWKLLAGIVFVTTLVVAVLDRRTLSGLIVMPLLTVVALPVVAKLAQAEKRFDLLGLMLFSVAAHFALSIMRFRGAVDAREYHTARVVPMALGVLGATMIRPHVALVFIVAMLVSLLVPRSAEGRSIRFGQRVAVLLLVLVAGSILARTTVEFLDLENLNSESVEFAFDRTEQRTDQGGSNFLAVSRRSMVSER